MVHKAICNSKPGKKLRRLQVALVQVKTGNTSENLLNEIHQSYFFVLRKRNY